jgi:hypothetical protein
MGFWEIAKGTKDLDRVARIHEGVMTARIANNQGEPVPMTEITVRWRRLSQSWEENPLIIPTDLLPIACQLAVSYQDADTYPVLHVDAASGNPEHGRYVTFKNDEVTVIELHTKPHVPEQNQDERRRAKLRGGNRVRTPDGRIVRVTDTPDLSDFEPKQ